MSCKRLFMNFEEVKDYIIPVLIIGYFARKYWRNKKMKSQIPSLIKEGGIIIDVRSRGEFSMGNNPKSINIPLDELDTRLNEIAKDKPILLCCASGGRSSMAAGILSRNGYKKIFNTGSWVNTL